ncbi:MAG: hypothetical protein U5L96_13985 [Owenweeksia sp.]|nr:hypothetical protein [Owenweeksia sp.]
MKFLKSASLLLLISAMHLQAQTDGLSEQVTSLKANVKEVQTEGDTYKQQIESPGLGVIKYTVDEVDSKGRITNYSYEFNLADLDPYAVRQETDGDLLLVSMTVANKQSLVKLTEDGENVGFDDEVELRATDIENARQLIDIIKKAIPLAKEAVENKLNLNGYAQMRDWLAANIKDVRVDETTYQQNLKPGEYPGSIVYVRTEAEGGDAEEMKYHFNIGDINHNSLRFEISGDEIGVTFKTMAEQDLIRVFENNEPDGFTDEVMIMTSNVESARDLRTVLGLAIPEAKKLTTNDLPSLNDTEAALASMAKFVSEVNYGDMQMIQEVAPECVTTFRITEQQEDDSEMMEYKLNLMDLNANNLKYEVSRGKMHFKLRTMDKIKLIKEYENGVFQGYTDEFNIYAEDMEVARRLRHALAKAIALCKKKL